MKKILIIIFGTLLLTGCGSLDEAEGKKLAVEAVNNMYQSQYIAEGAGLSVYADKFVEKDGKWYLVADYNSVSELIELVNNSYTGKVKDELIKNINARYKDINGKLYSNGQGGCNFPYLLVDSEIEIEKNIKVKSAKDKKLVVSINDKEFKFKKVNDKYVSEEKIYKCEK